MKRNASQHIVCLVAIVIFHYPFNVKDSYFPASCTEESRDIDCRKCSPNCVPLSDSHNVTSCNVTGLCYDGCQVGFYGDACNLTCSRNCPNETCHQDNGHCSFRCGDDICGDFCDQICDKEEKNITSSTKPDCDLSSSGSATAIGRSCFHLNIKERYCPWKMKNTMIKVMETGLVILLILLRLTVACEKCYNNNCDKEGICLNGCVVGFFGKKCSYPCQKGCVDNHCHLDNRGRSVCTIGCMPGYYGEQCRAPCHSTNIDNKCDRYTGVPPVCNGSRYGPHCLLDCQCHGQICDNIGICHDLCTNGYFGKDCRERCSSRCRICTDTALNCEVCHEGFYGDSCQYTCNSEVTREDMAGYKSVSGCGITKSRRHASGTSNEEIKTVLNSNLIIISVLICLHMTVSCSYLFMRWRQPKLAKKAKSVCIRAYADEDNHLRIW